MNRRTISCLLALGLLSMATRGFCEEFSDDFDEAKLGPIAQPWFVPTAGFTAKIAKHEKTQVLKVAAEPKSKAAVGNIMRMLDAKEFRGRHIALIAKIKIVSDSDDARAQMWMRVDRAGKRQGEFDNMHDRPMRPGKWHDVTIEMDVHKDAKQIALGILSFGRATVLIDEIQLKSRGEVDEQAGSPPRPVTDRGLQNLVAAARLFGYVRFFCPTDQVQETKQWDPFLIHLLEHAESAKDAKELAERLQSELRPFAPDLRVWAGKLDDGPDETDKKNPSSSEAHWVHRGVSVLDSMESHGIYKSSVHKGNSLTGLFSGGPIVRPKKRSYQSELGGGVCCRVPVRVDLKGGRTVPQPSDDDAKKLAKWSESSGVRLTALNRTTRLADVVIAWNVFQHFYPYFDVVKTDWNAVLPQALKQAAIDSSEKQFLKTLSELVASLKDGHGNVYSMSTGPRRMLPLAFAWAGDTLVVSGRSDKTPHQIKLGDVIESIDGKSIKEWMEEMRSQISSATDGWLKSMAATSLAFRFSDQQSDVEITFRHPESDETLRANLRVGNTYVRDAMTENRPENGSEVAEGIVYFDLNGASTEQLDKQMDKLKLAKGIVFDMRGYPGTAGSELMRHLITGPAKSARWLIPVTAVPDRTDVKMLGSGRWNMRPKKPRLGMPIAFLTDGRAISYAESVMGIVEHYKLGEIVGATTAGTNGNVNPFETPSGLRLSWTGMKVLKHDKSRHHGVGIRPTVPVEPTPKGIAAGRDEVLEKAIEVLMGKMAT